MAELWLMEVATVWLSMWSTLRCRQCSVWKHAGLTVEQVFGRIKSFECVDVLLCWQENFIHEHFAAPRVHMTVPVTRTAMTSKMGARMVKMRMRKYLDWSCTNTNSLRLLTTRRSTMEGSSEESEDEAAWRLKNTSWYILVVWEWVHEKVAISLKWNYWIFWGVSNYYDPDQLS